MPSNDNDSNHRSPMNDKMILAITTAHRTGVFVYENQYLYSVEKNRTVHLACIHGDNTAVLD